MIAAWLVVIDIELHIGCCAFHQLAQGRAITFRRSSKKSTLPPPQRVFQNTGLIPSDSDEIKRTRSQVDICFVHV